MICSMSSCEKKYDSVGNNKESTDNLDCDLDSTQNVNGQSNLDEKTTSQGDKLPDVYKQISENNKQDREYQVFYDCINENPYDKWLKNELEKGERAEKTIYAEYLAFWKDELVFTIESGEVIFDNKEQYKQWKSNIQQWLVISQEILKTEMDMMNCSLGQLEVIIPYCEMVRQKVIDTKQFLYYYQVYNTFTPYTNIEIKWCSK